MKRQARDGRGPASFPEHTIESLRALFAARRLTSRTLVARHLARIEAIDRRGPRINSIIEINPDALAQAAERDRERRAGNVRGPLHGVPVVLKDNIASADRMSTSAGSLALAGVRAPRDAFIVQRLRDAGAVVLGKTNLSEWANFRSTRSTSGWSSRGGLTRNPYALDRSCSGSSSGTAAAIAANLAGAGVGTETDGSIVSPASRCGLVGLKPTVGLVSRDGIVPIAATQDTAGPMTRCVADAAELLNVLAGVDARDAATATARIERDYTAFLDTGGLSGARLGVVRPALRHEGVMRLFDAALDVLRRRGAVLVEPVEMPAPSTYGEAEHEVLLHEFKAGIESWLAEFAAATPLRTLADLVDYNRRHAARTMPHFGQELFERALSRGGLDSPVYLEALARSRDALRTALAGVFDGHRLDALVAPSGGLAWLVDFVNGDANTGGFSAPAAIAGAPHITVPMGAVSGLPTGLSFVGPAWSEPVVIRLAYAFEQATHARVPPAFARVASG